MAPDKLLPPPHPWLALAHHFTTVESTMSVVRAFAEAGAPEGTHAVAAAQTCGRGRKGRTWSSAHAGVYLTFLLRPGAGINPIGLPLVFGLAAHDAVVAYTQAAGHVALAPRLKLKWPNDLLADEHKLGGILLEAEGLGTPRPWLLVGIGINVAPGAGLTLACDVQARYIGLMDLLAPPSTPRCQGRLGDIAPAVHVARLAQYTIAACHAAYRLWQRQGLTPTVARWCQRDALRGRNVQATIQGQHICGTAAGIDAFGRLRIDAPERTVWVESGEVFAVEPPVNSTDLYAEN